MAITSAEIHNQSFSIDRKGYDVDEVDVFLEHVADEIDGMNAQIAQLENQLDDRKFEGFDTPARVEAPVVVTDDAALAEKDARIADSRPRRPTTTPSRRLSSSRSVPQTRSSRTRMPRQRPPSKMPRTRARASWTRRKPSVRRCSTPSRSSRTTARTCARTTGTCSPTSSATLRASWPRSAARCPLPCRSARTIDVVETTATGRVTAPAQAPINRDGAGAYSVPQATGAVVAPATPTPSGVEKDLSGFGDADDAFEFEEID